MVTSLIKDGSTGVKSIVTSHLLLVSCAFKSECVPRLSMLDRSFQSTGHLKPEVRCLGFRSLGFRASLQTDLWNVSKQTIGKLSS